MSDPLSIHDMLRQTIIDGKLAIPLSGAIADLDTVDIPDDEFAANDALDVLIQADSILAKLDPEQQGRGVNRYETEEQHPSSNNDIVLSLKDVNLNRIVEARVLADDKSMDSDNAQELIHEALILSYLDHPGIPPVYDLDVSSNQQIYCTMKSIGGISLSALTVGIEDIDQVDIQAHKYDTVVELVNIFIKVAEIVAYAHSRQVIHRNLKPENFIIGHYGEVYVIDWKTAIDVAHDEPDTGVLRGTPLYMSPEQASCGEVDKRSDIYSLGASLFHVLLKRPHMMRNEFDAFWINKKQGVIDDLGEVKESQISAPLMAICHRCLAANPRDRYQNVDELIVDLKQYQSGQMVEVYKYGMMDLFRYWAKNNAMHVKWAMFLLLTAIVAGLVTYQVYLREQAGWGSPIYTENFDKAEEWKNEWVVRNATDGSIVKDGQLVTQNGPEFVWFYKKRLHGGVAIEFEGEMLPGSSPGDLSIMYSPDIESMDKGQTPVDVYYLQHAAVGNECSMIEGPAGRLDYVPLRLENGTKYKIRGEVDGKRLRLFLNGNLVCSYDLLFPLNSGYIGIYAYYNEKAIDNIKIYNRELPQVTNIIKTGDLLLENGLHELAIERYQTISELYPNSEIGRESQYKIGLCKYQLELYDEAFKIWDTLSKSEFAVQINFYRWNELVKAEDYNELLRQMYAMYLSANPRLKTQIREQWGLFLINVRKMGKKDLVREFLRFRDVNFPDDQIFSLETFYALQLLGEPQRALTMFPKQDIIIVQALEAMGEYQTILDKYPHMRTGAANAMRAVGREKEAIEQFGDLGSFRFNAMIAAGMLNEAAAEAKAENDQKDIATVMLARGQYDEVIEKYPGTYWGEESARIRKGEAQWYVDKAGEDANRSVTGYDAKTSLMLSRYMENDKTAIADLYDIATTTNYFQSTNATIVFQVDLLADILLHLDGTKEPLERTLNKIWKEKKRVMGMRHWYNVALMLGKINEQEYMAQPNQNSLLSEYLFHAAIREDLFGDKKTALRLYEEWLNSPLYSRKSNMTINKFVDFRVNALK